MGRLGGPALPHPHPRTHPLCHQAVLHRETCQQEDRVLVSLLPRQQVNAVVVVRFDERLVASLRTAPVKRVIKVHARKELRDYCTLFLPQMSNPKDVFESLPNFYKKVKNSAFLDLRRFKQLQYGFVAVY